MSYLPRTGTSTSRTWATDMTPNARAVPQRRISQYSTGTGGSYNRGWGGDAESRFANVRGALRQATDFGARVLGYEYATGIANRGIEQKLSEIEEDVHPAGLGAPQTTATSTPGQQSEWTQRTADATPLSRRERLQFSDERGLSSSSTAQGPFDMGGPRAKPMLELGPGPAVPLALNAGPRVFPMGPGKVINPLTEGFGKRMQQARPGGSLRNQAPGPGFTPPPVGQRDAARRTKAGMDPLALKRLFPPST